MNLKNEKSAFLLKGLAASMMALLCLGCAKGPTTGATSTPAATPAATTAATPAATPTAAATAGAEGDQADAGGWVESEVADGLISVMAPEQLKANDTGDSTIVYATSDEAYAIIVTTGADMNEEPAEALKMLKGMVIQEAGAEETHSEMTEVQGGPAMRFGLKTKDEAGNEIPVEMLTTIVGGNTLVQIAVTNGDHEKFFESVEFDVTDAGGEEVEETDAEVVEEGADEGASDEG